MTGRDEILHILLHTPSLLEEENRGSVHKILLFSGPHINGGYLQPHFRFVFRSSVTVTGSDTEVNDNTKSLFDRLRL